MERTNDELELLQLGDLRGHLDCLLTDISKACEADPNYRIQIAMWESVKAIPDEVPYLRISTSKYDFDEGPSTLVLLLRLIRGPINARFNELNSFLQAQKSRPPADDVDRILEGKVDANIHEAATYLGKTEAHVHRLATQGSIAVVENSRPRRFSCESLRAYLRPNAVKPTRG